MTSITVPTSLREAQTELGTLGMLLTAAEWHRAAIIAAFVDNPSDASDFAALGITGLKTKETVLIYAERWIEAHGTRPIPGDTVILPTLEWKGTRTGTDGLNSPKGAKSTMEKMIAKHGAKAIARMLLEQAPTEVRTAIYEAQMGDLPTRDGLDEIGLSDENLSAVRYIDAGGDAARARKFLLSAIRFHGEARDILELAPNEKSLLHTRLELRRILDLWDAIAAGAPADLSEFDSEVSE